MASEMKTKKGFTLMEMLVVIGVMVTLVAVLVPVFSSSLHKAKVSADKANVRAYYAELQVNYQETGEHLDNSRVPYFYGTAAYDYKTIKFPVSNRKAVLRTGYYVVGAAPDGGYTVIYNCTGDHDECELLLE